MPHDEKSFRSGYIAIVGLPNVGKSTLLNSLIGKKVAITSDKPQTTREKIAGILTLPGSQMVFLDSPGFQHQYKTRLTKLMGGAISDVLNSADIVVVVCDATKQKHLLNTELIDVVRASGKDIILLLNKVDSVRKDQLLPMIKQCDDLKLAKHIIPISALKHDGTSELIKVVLSMLPEGPKYYEDDLYTETTIRHFAEEIIREKIFNQTYMEIPYSTCVVLEKFEDTDTCVYIDAVIYVEKDSQKGIIIGKGGLMLKEVGRNARLEIQNFLQKKVFLTMFAKVNKTWQDEEAFLKEIYHL